MTPDIPPGDIKEGQKLAVGDAQGHLHIQNIPKHLGLSLSLVKDFRRLAVYALFALPLESAPPLRNLIKPGGREKENMRHTVQSDRTAPIVLAELPSCSHLVMTSDTFWRRFLDREEKRPGAKGMFQACRKSTASTTWKDLDSGS